VRRRDRVAGDAGDRRHILDREHREDAVADESEDLPAVITDRDLLVLDERFRRPWPIDRRCAEAPCGYRASR
jgi:hypothetical protein